MDSAQSSIQASSLLEISKFQNPNLHFPQSQTIVPIHKCNIIQDIPDLVDERSPGFIRLFIPSWREFGLTFQTGRTSVVENNFLPHQRVMYPLELLSMAQETRLRLTKIIQYLHLVRRIHLLKVQRLRGQKPAKKGQRVDTVATDILLKEIYGDWEDMNEGRRVERRDQLRKDNKQARKWLLAASRLSFGVLLICGKALENKIEKHITGNQIIALTAHINDKFPLVVEAYRLLDSTAKNLLNQEKVSDNLGMESIALRIDEIIHSGGSFMFLNEFPFAALPTLSSCDADPTHQQSVDTINPSFLLRGTVGGDACQVGEKGDDRLDSEWST